MKTRSKIIIYIIFNFFSVLYAQDLRSNLSNNKIDKGIDYCDELNFKRENKINTFLYCKTVYTQKNQIRNALNVIEIANKKFPYSYEIRLQKALMLQEIGNPGQASSELIGLVKLYPEKFELHNYLGRVQFDNNRIMSVMPFIVSLTLDSKHPLAAENLIFIKRLLSNKLFPHEMNSPAPKQLLATGENNFDFSIYELTRNSVGVQHTSDRDYLLQRVKILINSLEKTNYQQSGFFWEYYAAYFKEIEANGLLDDLVDSILKKSKPNNKLVQVNAKYGLY